MPVTIHIDAVSAFEAMLEMQNFLRGLTAGPEPLAAEEVPAGEEKTFPEPKRRPRPPKAKEPEAGETVLPFSEPAADASAPASEASFGPSGAVSDSSSATIAGEPAAEADKPFTQDDARAALADLLAQPDGKAKAQAVFAEFGCVKLSEIPAESYKAFIAAIAKSRGL